MALYQTAFSRWVQPHEHLLNSIFYLLTLSINKSFLANVPCGTDLAVGHSGQNGNFTALNIEGNFVLFD